MPAAEARRLGALAARAARAAGQVARARFGAPLSVRFKSDDSEVTDADLEAERAAIAVIRADRPHDALLTEEQTDAPPAHVEAGCTWWVIDPIDGTRNFVRGVPAFAACVAVIRDGAVLAGAIYDVMQDALTEAHAGGALRFNGASVAAPPRHDGRPLVAIPSMPVSGARQVVIRAVDHMVVRNFGSSALHLALVARGLLDAVVLARSKLWDVAAGWLMVRQAGGEVRRLDGRLLEALRPEAYGGEDIPLVAGRAEVVAELLS